MSRPAPQQHAVLKVKVVPGASRDRIAGAYGDGIKVTVTSPPERGAANEAVLDLLATALSVPRPSVTITSGQTAPRKEVQIQGLSQAEARRRLGLK